jgi:hypothetical protein
LKSDKVGDIHDRMSVALPNYTSLVESYCHIYGKNSIHVLFFEDFILSKEKVLRSVYDIFQKDCQESFFGGEIYK